jgi:hypothetical protein
MKTRLVVSCAGLLVTACLPATVVEDPRAVAPDYDRWDARSAAAPRAVFAAALDVLADSGFTARHADPSVGIIGTNLRRMSVAGDWGNYRLDFMVLPAGDSARLVIRGEFCHVIDGAQQCYALRATNGDWRLVRSMGEAILARSGP